MSGPEDSSYPEDWLRIARRDWRRVHAILRGGDAELAAFLLQQCLEKYLKAYLLARGWRLQRTHELDTLLDAASRFEPEIGRYQELCERVSGYYVIDRYPVLREVQVDTGRVEEELSAATELISRLHPGEPPVAETQT